MMTFRQFSQTPQSIPANNGWYLADLGEARGKQELFTRRSPQRREQGKVECLGRGRTALWRKVGN